MSQELLLKKIEKHIPDNKSLIDVISEVLDISYASAQRRVTKNAKLSMEEAVLLAKKFKLSLDSIFQTNDDNIITFEKSKIINTLKGFETYFKGFSQQLEFVDSIENSSLIYTTKDLAISTTYEFASLTKFKIFVWLKLLNPSFKSRIFSSFEIPSVLKKGYQKVGEQYKATNVSEIWDITSLNSTLKQILYYVSINQLTNYDALTLCKELKGAIQNVQRRATPDSSLKIYYNPLIVTGNQIFFQSPLGSALYVQHTAMNFFKTVDVDTCLQVKEYLDSLLENSTLLNKGNEKEKSIFFNKLFSKIESLENNIKSTQELDF